MRMRMLDKKFAGFLLVTLFGAMAVWGETESTDGSATTSYKRPDRPPVAPAPMVNSPTRRERPPHPPLQAESAPTEAGVGTIARKPRPEKVWTNGVVAISENEANRVAQIRPIMSAETGRVARVKQFSMLPAVQDGSDTNAAEVRVKELQRALPLNAPTTKQIGVGTLSSGAHPRGTVSRPLAPRP